MTNKLTAAYWNINERQWSFALEYVANQNLNATEVALKVGYGNDNHESAKTTASRLLSDGNVLGAIAYLIDERTKRTMINSDWMLTRLAEAVTADVADLYELDGQLKPVHQWPKVWRTGLVTGLKVEPTFVGGGIKMNITEIKHVDRTKLLEMIGKHVDVQAFKDRVAVETDLTPWGSVVAAEHVRGQEQ